MTECVAASILVPFKLTIQAGSKRKLTCLCSHIVQFLLERTCFEPPKRLWLPSLHPGDQMQSLSINGVQVA